MLREEELRSAVSGRSNTSLKGESFEVKIKNLGVCACFKSQVLCL